jgi:DNA-binding transcriptional ArsR family regulator
MSGQPERLERLVERQLGACCEADVQERIEALEGYASAVPAGADRDRAALTTLGNETRYRIVRLLAAADGELCVCEITPVVDVSDSAISHALSDLHDAGLVARRKEGTWRYYAATDRARALLDALDATRGDG